jgi:formylmethanofuran dehydrogenase subunit D
VAAYFPETNVLTSINNVAACGTPAYKSVSVQVTPAAAG